MHCHANARLTPRGRMEVFAGVEAGTTVTAACVAFRISRRTITTVVMALTSLLRPFDARAAERAATNPADAGAGF